MNIAIYGAQSIALSLYKALSSLASNRVIQCFVVTDKSNNPDVLCGLPVFELSEYKSNLSKKDNVHILIATPENVQPDIEENLINYGFNKFTRIDSKYWCDIMQRFYIKNNQFKLLRNYPKGCTDAFIRLYTVMSGKDRKLIKERENNEWTYPIHAGAGLEYKKIANYCDDSGNNISFKNNNYCELTALYWVWKNKITNILSDNINNENSIIQYYGIEQYRRIFDISKQDILRFADNDIDVILPYPMIYEPNIELHHNRYVKKQDWNVVLDVIKKLYPNDFHKYISVLKQSYFYNYNMILARKEILNEYCEWLFSILEKVEISTIPKCNERNDRYIGYIAETLETMYFMANRDRFNIVHCGYEFLI